MPKDKGRRPDYNLTASVKNPDGTYGPSVTVGAGWDAANGRVSLRLNVGTSLRWDDGLALTLHPADEKE